MSKYREHWQGRADLTACGVMHGWERKAVDEAEVRRRLDLLCTATAALEKREMKITPYGLMDGRNSIMRGAGHFWRGQTVSQKRWTWREKATNDSESKYSNEYIHLTVTNYKDNQCFICHIMNGCRYVIKQSKWSKRLIKELVWKGQDILTVIMEALLTCFVCEVDSVIFSNYQRNLKSFQRCFSWVCKQLQLDKNVETKR